MLTEIEQTEIKPYNPEHFSHRAHVDWTEFWSYIAFCQPLTVPQIKEIMRFMTNSNYTLEQSMYIIRGIMHAPRACSQEEAAMAIASM